MPVAVLRARPVADTALVVWALGVDVAGDVSLHSGVVDLDVQAPTLSREPSPLCAALPVMVASILPALHQLGRVLLVVTNDHARAMLMAVEDVLPDLVMVAGADRVTGGEQAANRAGVAVSDLYRQVTAPKVVSVAKVSKPLTIATDGSMRTGHMGGGAAWVREDWKAGTLQCPSERDINVVELAGIVAAVVANRYRPEGLVIRSDSQTAVGWASEALESSPFGPGRARRLQRQLAATRTAGLVRVEWVRGHAGDVLNEVADRLAVLTRRDMDAGIVGDEHQLRVAAVLDDARQAVGAAVPA